MPSSSAIRARHLLVAVALVLSLVSPRAHGDALVKIIGMDDLVPVEDTTAAPWSSTVKIRGHFPHKTNGCTGTMIGSNAVLTAAHCVYDKDDVIAGDWFEIIPGKAGSLEPFGRASSTTYLMNPAYPSTSAGEEKSNDWAVIIVDEALGFQTGWLSLGIPSAAELITSWLVVPSYPSGDCEACALDYDGLHMYVDEGPTIFVTDTYVDHGIDTMPGSSGAAMWVDDTTPPTIYAIHRGDYTESGKNTATRLTLPVVQEVLTFAASHCAVIDSPCTGGEPVRVGCSDIDEAGCVGADGHLWCELGFLCRGTSSEGQALPPCTEPLPSCGDCHPGTWCGVDPSAPLLCVADGCCPGVPAEGVCAGEDDTLLVWCDEGSTYSMDCSLQGTTCGVDPELGMVTCLCVLSCDGRVCGPDGCGGTCGACDVDHECTPSGTCEAMCLPSCDGRACGSDGCGGACGVCSSGSSCRGGSCEVDDDSPEPDDASCAMGTHGSPPWWLLVAALLAVVRRLARRLPPSR